MIFKGFSFLGLSISLFFSEVGVPAGWTRVSEGFGSHLFEQRRGRRNSRPFSGGLFFRVDGLNIVGFELFWATARLIKLSPTFSGLFFKRVGAFGSV